MASADEWIEIYRLISRKAVGSETPGGMVGGSSSSGFNGGGQSIVLTEENTVPQAQPAKTDSKCCS
jgi:hypothetical protein